MSSQKEVVKVILVTSSSRRGVNLSINTTYNKLVTYVGKKFNLDMDRGYTLSYKLSAEDYAMELTDDDEVAFFVEAAQNMNGRPIELFIVEPTMTRQSSQVKIPLSHPTFYPYPNQHHYLSDPSCQYQTPTQFHDPSRYHHPIYINQPYLTTFEQLPSNQAQSPLNSKFGLCNKNQNYETQQFLELGFSQNPKNDGSSSQQPDESKFVYYNENQDHETHQFLEIGLSLTPSYDVGTSKNQTYDGNEEVRYDSGQEYGEHGGEECGEGNDDESGEESDTDYGFFSDEGDENDDGNAAYIPPSEWKNNTFTYIPKPLPTASLQTKPSLQCIYDGASETKLAEGMWFFNKDHCKSAIAHKSLVDGRQYKVRNSSKTRFDVVCFNEGCNWKIVTRRAKQGEPFRVTKLYDFHTCSNTQTKTKHRNACKEVLGDIIAERLKDPHRVLRPKDIIEDINDTYKIKISYQQAWRGREAALEKLRGGHAESFSKLPYYLHNLTLKNPGTVTDIKTDQYGRFEMCFVALAVSVSLVHCITSNKIAT